MKEINSCDFESVYGGILPLVAGCVMGAGGHAAVSYLTNKPITASGLATSCAIGAFTGGLGSTLVKASGGGTAAWLAHKPSMEGLGLGLNSILNRH